MSDLLFRPVRPDDAPLFTAAMAEVSDETLYRRFHSHKRKLTARELEYLTCVDMVAHAAWVALTVDERRLVGVARYVRDEEAPSRAEVAVLVHDDFHGQGVGSQLMTMLRGHAAAMGVERFTALVQRDNVPVRALLERTLPAPHRQRPEDGLLEIVAPVTASAAAR